MVGYIRVRTKGASDNNGYILYCSNINTLDFQKGVQTVDLTLPTSSAAGRLLTPISGLKEDFTLQLELIDDGTNKAFSVDNIGNLTALNKVTTKEQLKFLINTFMVADLNASYSFVDDWYVSTSLSEAEVSGHLTISGSAQEDSFFSSVKVQAQFKVGKNVFSLF
jgi:hypothetical protein